MYMDKEGFTSKITNMYIECKSSSEFTFNIMFDTKCTVKDSIIKSYSIGGEDLTIDFAMC